MLLGALVGGAQAFSTTPLTLSPTTASPTTASPTTASPTTGANNGLPPCGEVIDPLAGGPFAGMNCQGLLPSSEWDGCVESAWVFQPDWVDNAGIPYFYDGMGNPCDCTVYCCAPYDVDNAAFQNGDCNTYLLGR
jgi:hypothetical protein